MPLCAWSRILCLPMPFMQNLLFRPLPSSSGCDITAVAYSEASGGTVFKKLAALARNALWSRKIRCLMSALLHTITSGTIRRSGVISVHIANSIHTMASRTAALTSNRRVWCVMCSCDKLQSGCSYLEKF
jgi:hypothetical protein